MLTLRELDNHLEPQLLEVEIDRCEFIPYPCGIGCLVAYKEWAVGANTCRITLHSFCGKVERKHLVEHLDCECSIATTAS